MEKLRLSHTTYQLIERTVEALERIGRDLERYNDWDAVSRVREH